MSEPKETTLNARKRILNGLAEKFPKCFFPKEVAPKPLKIGIFNDLKSHFQSEWEDKGFRKELQLFFRWYVGRKSYLRTLLANDAMRIGLDGEILETVEEKDKHYAKARLESFKKKRQSKKPEFKVESVETIQMENPMKQLSESLNKNFAKSKLTLKKVPAH